MAGTRSALVVLLLVVGLVVSVQGQVAVTPVYVEPAPDYQVTYISYVALTADRAPCAAGIGLSYYTQNCTYQGYATPYTRGCYEITRCARG